MNRRPKNSVESQGEKVILPMAISKVVLVGKISLATSLTEHEGAVSIRVCSTQLVLNVEYESN